MPAHPHLDSLHRALAAAGAWERDELERLAALPREARIAAGVSWPVLMVEEVGWAGRGRTRSLLRAGRGVLLHEGLGPGDTVEIEVGGERLEARLEDAGSGWAEVRVFGVLEEGETVTLTKRFDPTPWRRLADALARGDGHASPLRDVLLGIKPPSPPLDHPPRLEDPELNPSQRDAGRIALGAGEVALLHGPPGTGKTKLLVSLLQVLVHEDRPWALADSNAAVDHLVARAARVGLDVVRVGSWGRMSEVGRRFSLRRRIEDGPLGKALAVMDKDLAKLANRSDPDSRRAWGRLYAERRALRQQAEHGALESAQVIATTLGTLAWRGRELPPAKTALIDEATQALEPSIWTAVPHVERLILFGDPHQLGPVVQQPESPLARSLLDRLLDPDDPAGGVLPLPMLTTQHRMHAKIQALVQSTYGDAYAPHASVAEHGLTDLPGVQETELTQASTLWIDTAGADASERLDEATRSRHNPVEAALVEQVIVALREAGVALQDIGVITPYSAQVRALRDRLGPRLKVASMNGFQGQEREVIIHSWVRSNPDGELGFVADRRRLTVALTRARRLLVGIGDSATLGRHPRFAELLDHLDSTGSMSSVWEPPWSEALP